MDICNVERRSIRELNKMVEELGHADATLIYYYVEPDKDLSNGLRELSTDQHINMFCEWAYTFIVMEMYCNHLIEEEIVEVLTHELALENDMQRRKSGGS